MRNDPISPHSLRHIQLLDFRGRCAPLQPRTNLFHGGPIMTRWTVHFIWAGLLVSIVALSRAETSTNSTSADDEKAKPEFPAQMKIGVVDVKQVFTKYKPFNEKMAAIKAKVEKAEAKVKDQADEIKKLAEEARDRSASVDELR